MTTSSRTTHGYRFRPFGMTPAALAPFLLGLALAASTAKRSAALPDVPTVAEAGVSGYAFDPWFGILAPAKTPKALLDKLSGEIARIVQLPDVKEQLRALGADPAPTTPEGFDAYVREEVAKFQKIVKDAGIKPE